MSMNEEILNELKKLTKIMTISNGEKIESELAQYATSEERKMIWVLLDGKNQSDDIARTIGKVRRTVDIFLQILEDANLIERKYNQPPMRILDYVPASWIESLQKKGGENKEKEQTEQAQLTQEKSEVKSNGG